MKRIDLYHPRVFDTQDWAEKYYKNNLKNIQRTGKDITRILEKLGFTSGKILDAGCGFGAVDIEIAQAFPQAEITGIDLSQPLLDIAQKDAEIHNVADRITFQTGDVHKLDFESGSFDVVINTFLLHIAEHPVEMLNELERVAKPQGQIIIFDLCRNWLAWFVKELRKSHSTNEAAKIINSSQIRNGKIVQGAFWWAWLSNIKK